MTTRDQLKPSQLSKRSKILDQHASTSSVPSGRLAPFGISFCCTTQVAQRGALPFVRNIFALSYRSRISKILKFYEYSYRNASSERRHSFSDTLANPH